MSCSLLYILIHVFYYSEVSVVLYIYIPWYTLYIKISNNRHFIPWLLYISSYHQALESTFIKQVPAGPMPAFGFFKGGFRVGAAQAESKITSSSGVTEACGYWFGVSLSPDSPASGCRCFLRAEQFIGQLIVKEGYWQSSLYSEDSKVLPTLKENAILTEMQSRGAAKLANLHAKLTLHEKSLNVSLVCD